MNEKFFEFFKDPTAYIKRLLRRCLQEKWHVGSESGIAQPCPFCMDVYIRDKNNTRHCYFCLCPPEICGDSENDDIVSLLGDSYGNGASISDIEDEDLEKAITLFDDRLYDLDCKE